jgi:N-methylhydantoinase A/acetophenone carboxylase
MRPGHRVDGPAIAEADFTTIVIPPGRTLTISEHGLGLLETAQAASAEAATHTLETSRS